MNDKIVTTIYQMAKTQNEQQLSEFLSTHSVGLIENDESAIQILARENDEQSVDFLISKFEANVNAAVMGAAQGNHSKLMVKLLAAGGLLNFALTGAVLGNHIEMAKKILKKGPLAINDSIKAAATNPSLRIIYDLLMQDKKNPHPHAEYDALIGASKYNNRELLEELLNQKIPIYLAILGAASGGHFDVVDDLLQRNLPNKSHALNFALQGAAIYGSIEYINKYQEQADFNFIADGLGETGNSNLFIYFMNEVPDLKKIIFLNRACYAAGKGGHANFIRNLIGKGAIPDLALRGAAEKGHIFVLNVLSEYLNEENYSNVIEAFRTGGIITDNKEEMARIATFIQDERLKDLFIAKL